MRKKKGSGFLLTLIYAVIFAFIAASGFTIIRDALVKKDARAFLMLAIIMIFIVIDSIFDRTNTGKLTIDAVYGEEKRKKEKVKAERERMLRCAIYNQVYPEKPCQLSWHERKLFNSVYMDAMEKLVSMGAYKISIPLDMTAEEVFTLWYKRGVSAPINVYVRDAIMVVDVSVLNDKAVVPDISGYLTPHEANYTASKIRKKISPAVKKQRKAHEAAEERRKLNNAARKKTAEKKRQPPNYDFCAKEWILNNNAYVNKLIAVSGMNNNGHIIAFIPSDKLPKDQTTWKVIAKKLKEDGVILRYEIKDGIVIKK